MKKLFAFLAATLVIASCGGVGDPDRPYDPTDDPWEDPDDEPEEEIIDFPDYGDWVGRSYEDLVDEFDEPNTVVDNTCVYLLNQEVTQTLIFFLNPANQHIYQIAQTLQKDFYTPEQIRAYFDDEYYDYGTSVSTYTDENGHQTAVTLYQWGNTVYEAEATLVITLVGNETVTYADPTVVPEEITYYYFGNLDPIDVVSAFLGMGIEYILDEYGNKLVNGGYYYTGLCDEEQNDYLSCFELFVEDGAVAWIGLSFKADLTDDEIIGYYEDAGYDIHKGWNEAAGEYEYTFYYGKAGILYTYSNHYARVRFDD